MEVDAVILFMDIRGFTRWAEATEVFASLDDFIARFIPLIEGCFPKPTFVKPLGDGAMIVRELAAKEADLQELLAETLATIKGANDEFAVLCQQFARKVGHRTDLHLAWSVVRGKVKKAGGDYVGSNVNKASRLCDIARPSGIVVDQADFPSVPPPSENFPRFYAQTRQLSGLEETSVWVTEEIQSQFLPRERLRQLPEVHVAGFCIDKSQQGLRVLLARRSEQRELYPGLIEGCGGQLAPNESFEAGVQRHFRLELDLEVRVLTDFHCFYQIREPNQPLIPGIRFLCEWTGKQDPLSSPHHSRVWWATETELRRTPAEQFIPGLKREVLDLIHQYKQKRKPATGPGSARKE